MALSLLCLATWPIQPHQVDQPEQAAELIRRGLVIPDRNVCPWHPQKHPPLISVCMAGLLAHFTGNLRVSLVILPRAPLHRDGPAAGRLAFFFS